jgi:peptidoglycan pentaglycine glycine transferase (the first glycine)
MQLIELNPQHKESYNNFVATRVGGSFLQSWEWGEWQVSLGRKVSRYKIQDTNGEWVGAAQFIEMPIGNGKRYWYCPYGPIIDLRFKIKDLRFLLQEQFSDAVFVRIEPKQLISTQAGKQVSLTKTKNIQPGKTLVLDLTKTEEELLAGMHNKTRYNIKVAGKHGVVVGVGGSNDAVDLISETSKRQGYTAQEKDYFKNMVSFFAEQGGNVNLSVYRAVYNNMVLASAIIMDFGDTRTYLFGGSSDQNKNVMAPYLLHWQAILDAKQKGIKKYDFWGIETASGETPGFVRFKLGFGGEQVSYRGAYDVVQNRLWYTIYTIGRKLNRLLK